MIKMLLYVLLTIQSRKCERPRKCNKKIMESLATTDSVKMDAAVKQKDKGLSNGQ